MHPQPRTPAAHPLPHSLPHPPQATRHPHAAWYLLPALLLTAAVACVGLAAFEGYQGAIGTAHTAVNSFADSLVGSLRDVTTYGDGNPVPPHAQEQAEHHASAGTSHYTTGFVLLKVAAGSALASLIGFGSIALARARARDRNRQGHRPMPQPVPAR